MKANVLRPVLTITVLTAVSLACAALSSLPGTGGGSPQPGGGGDSTQPVTGSDSTQPVTGGGSVLLQDDFSDSGSGWGTGTDADSTVEYVDGGLHMQNFKTDFITWSNPDQETYSDVHLEVTVKSKGGDTGMGFGLICNQQVTDSAYYYFALRSDGKYAIAKSSVAKNDVFLTNNNDWASSDLITPNAPSYRIGADCGAGNLVLYVDGKQIDSVSDSSYAKGGVGLFLLSRKDLSGEVTYDDFVMTSLK